MKPAIDGIGIVADDLTGGAAIGGEIARLGHVVDLVSLSNTVQPRRSIVVETGSRYIPADLSAERVKNAVRFLVDAGCPVIMKKIDSTLKGNVATDLAAFAASCPGQLLIAPSCPEVGLTLRAGQQFTPRGPGISVLDLLSAAMPGSIATLDIDTIRRGTRAVSQWLRTHPDQMVLADSETEADLAAVAAGAAEAGSVSFGGTYGLGAALATAYLGPGTSSRYLPPTVDRMIVIAGSASAATARQITHLTAAGAEEIVLDVERILHGEAETEAQRAQAWISSSAAKVLVVHTAAARTQERVRRHCDRLGWNERDLANLLAMPFTAAVRAAAGSAIYFVGGETTGAVFDRIGLGALVIRGECSPAVPLAVGETVHEWPLILTKPGAFGVNSVLTDAADQLVGPWHTRTDPATKTKHPSFQ
jgi:D-threonate/D-erythronate kinase